ncbi:MAG: MinD/ParA family protein [Candidatus Thiodiazotropha sp. (ex Lucina aurantia)]|nr:P-loop NTPase [Candidatus Thiodiazotropha sp. (ex Lucina pensylvanica)]MBT3017736.1 P-loop NTPase [Candidatus Thiodiazotropha taylori]MBT3040813.1 P-loop NTPase [Candidatus Thiodiazotropha sp. (ex Codakia orbicularis)]MBV2103876.1 MinD/ParA family protein [Candidatus Thiodiazotropha sp. (ex Lucina aurantia)]MCG7861151.1 MinD/ParA family protein [Candidatus Thiodiazotropha endolucinida]MCU7943044.1 MinD/ParA family protein [Candidatus Thiodiazotropha sp. (ex Cardiolucina cf. quadrata)]
MSEQIEDQATGLRRMINPEPVRVIAVTGGKGGVGKTSISANLGVAFAELGRRVMLLDADLGLANLDVILGLHAERNLSHVMQGECTLEDVMVTGPKGMRVVPGASGIQHMAEMTPAENAGLIHAFSEVANDVDVLLIDTAAGISDLVISFSRAAQEQIVVVCDEPASITDAYAIIKLLNREHGISRFRILANMVKSVQEGRDLYNKMCRVTDQYLDVMLNYMGSIPYDEQLRKAVRSQKPVVEAYPRSRVSQAFKNLAKKADNWPVPSGVSGDLQFFVERLIQFSSQYGEI